jgi:hypothetical protein
MAISEDRSLCVHTDLYEIRSMAYNFGESSASDETPRLRLLFHFQPRPSRPLVGST